MPLLFAKSRESTILTPDTAIKIHRSTFFIELVWCTCVTRRYTCFIFLIYFEGKKISNLKGKRLEGKN